MSDENSVAILTPSYNRVETLERLYQSLIGQSCQNFSWLIVDDGSTDGTEHLVEEWIRQDKIRIIYRKKENGGKHTALNMGIKEVIESLTFIVDSDDYLTIDAVETVLQYAKKYEGVREKLRLCGFSFLRHDSKGKVNAAYFRKNEQIGNYVDIRINGNIGGDKAEVFYTSVLKEFPFKEYPNEKFMPEDAVWVIMSQKYDMVHVNKGIYICDYLEGGLTRTGRSMKVKSPRGMMLRSILFINDRHICSMVRLKMLILYIIYSRFAGIDPPDAADKIRAKIFFYLLYIPGMIIQWWWKRAFVRKRD